MEMRAFGGTGISLSVLGVCCGAVGGLMVRGRAAGASASRTTTSWRSRWRVTVAAQRQSDVVTRHRHAR